MGNWLSANGTDGLIFFRVRKIFEVRRRYYMLESYENYGSVLVLCCAKSRHKPNLPEDLQLLRKTY